MDQYRRLIERDSPILVSSCWSELGGHVRLLPVTAAAESAFHPYPLGDHDGLWGYFLRFLRSEVFLALAMNFEIRAYEPPHFNKPARQTSNRPFFPFRPYRDQHENEAPKQPANTAAHTRNHSARRPSFGEQVRQRPRQRAIQSDKRPYSHDQA
jgi:hypothetical protein